MAPDVEQLKRAIDANDVRTHRRDDDARSAAHSAPLGCGGNGPLTWVAECRVPSPARLEMATWMIDHGSDVHQGGDGPLMRAALDDDRIPMMALLVGRGADVNARWNGQTEWRRERLRCCGKISGRRAGPSGPAAWDGLKAVPYTIHISILETVMAVPLSSPVSFTVWPACVARSLKS